MTDEVIMTAGDILLCTIDIGGIAFFMERFFRLRIKRVWFLICFAASVAFMYGVNTFFSNGISNLVMLIMEIFIFTTIFKTTISQKIFSYASIIMIMIIAELTGSIAAVEGGIYSFNESSDYHVVQGQYDSYFLLSVLCDVAIYIMFFLFSIWVKKKDVIRNEKGIRIQDICLSIVSALSFAVIWIVLVQKMSGKIGGGICVFIFIAMLLIIIIFYYSYEHMINADRAMMEKKLLEEEYAHKKAYYEQMEKHQNEIRKIRHDLKNQLIGIMGGAERKASAYVNAAIEKNSDENSAGEHGKEFNAAIEKNSDENSAGEHGKEFSAAIKKNEIEIAIQQIMDDITSSEIDSYTENIHLNMILNDKIRIARSKGITTDLDIKVPRELPMDMGDLGILCGNLLDNAIEAAEKCNAGDRKILFHAYYYRSSLVISCKNSIAAPVISLDTDKADKLNHGIGIRSIDEIAAKYNGKRESSFDNKAYQAEVNMWLDR